ncbi:major facilitator superfamily domain-containing protein [Staphylotrichum tortipilum]|uniref:Major facilitator superfamily domain-containing protein n=1 Tax=Staphylotrichum tortipilum TaxID=2831512 RepID=A0AAN6MC60_9PEZI|nr:major facilitator superfamily domain-containing protein [Staphylotrichum longicolle]
MPSNPSTAPITGSPNHPPRPRPPPEDANSKLEAEAIEACATKAASPSPSPSDPSAALTRSIRRKVDLRLCTIAGLLCSLNLLDSGVLSSAAVTSMPTDLGLDAGNRFSVSIFVLTVASIAFQLPATVAVRVVGPRRWFAGITVGFGVVTLGMGFVRSWWGMVVLRVVLGAVVAGVFPGLAYLVSAWYPRREQQLRFAFMQSGEVVVLATGSLVNYGLERLGGRGGLEGWRWMFVVQGLCTCVVGVATYWWMVDFPEDAHRSFWFLTSEEAEVMAKRIQADRGDLVAEEFAIGKVLVHAKDLKVWAFASLFFMQNIVSTALAYFVPVILQHGLGYSADAAIILSAPPYYYAVVPVVLSSWLADRFGVRAPIIVFNALCLITGFAALGFAGNSGARYFGVFLATGAYVANWAALTAYQANNVVGQWKRVFTVAACTMFNGAGGIAGSFIVRNFEAPAYTTAVWVSIGSHMMMICVVAALSLYFYLINNSQRQHSKVLEQTVGFRYTY